MTDDDGPDRFRWKMGCSAHATIAHAPLGPRCDSLAVWFVCVSVIFCATTQQITGLQTITQRNTYETVVFNRSGAFSRSLALPPPRCETQPKRYFLCTPADADLFLLLLSHLHRFSLFNFHFCPIHKSSKFTSK